jgi:ABC-type transport system involved in multi-copper enzyme maturation permease subunit
MHEPLAVVGGVLTAIIAARQIFFEDLRKTFNLLLHLPLPRSTIFLTKMLAALMVYFVAMLIPVLVYALWAATPGNHPSPFFWWMAWLPFPLILLFPLLYFGWLLTWLRPVSWFGTRLLPLVATIALFIMFGELVQFMPWMWILVILTDVLLVISILWVVENRDY